MTADSREWEAASKPIVPAVAGYKTTANEASVDWKAIAADHIAFWRELQEFGPLGPRAPFWLRQDRAALRQYAYGIGQTLASRLSAVSETDLAREVLDAAAAIREEPVAAAAQYNPYDIY